MTDPSKEPTFEEVVTSQINNAYGFGGDDYISAILAAHNADIVAVLEKLRESVNGSSTMHPLYADLNRDQAIDDARNTVQGLIHQLITKYKENSNA